MLRYYDDQGSWVEGYYDAAGAWVETSLPPGAGGAGGYAGESAAVQVRVECAVGVRLLARLLRHCDFCLVARCARTSQNVALLRNVQVELVSCTF